MPALKPHVHMSVLQQVSSMFDSELIISREQRMKHFTVLVFGVSLV